jgi:hypothetical protein
MGRWSLLAACAGIAAAIPGSSAVAGAHGTAAPCAGHDLSGTFAAVPGSAGAGQISYTVRLRNRSTRACFVSGLPTLRLLDRAERPLPTHVSPAHPGQLTAVRVVLRPGGYAAATARFSPDVPGPGEQVARQCERTAYHVRVTAPPGTGSLVAPVLPATPVCEHGRMVLSVLVAGRNGPAHA